MTEPLHDELTSGEGGSGARASSKLAEARAQVRDGAEAAKHAAGDAYETAREKVTTLYSVARDRTSQAYSTALDKTSDAYGTAKQKFGEAGEAAREGYGVAKRRTAQGIDDAPLAALLGGAALGVLAGVLLPRTRKEEEVLGPIGHRITDAAREAALAARDAGKQTLDDLGINADSARDTVNRLVENAGSAAASRVKGSE